MAKKIDYASMAAQVVENLGGKENLVSVNHCATRLRVVVKDSAAVQENQLKKIEGVIGVAVRDGETQVIVGQIIEDLNIQVEKLVGNTKASTGKKSKGKNPVTMFANFLQMMAGIMSPVIPALIAAGFLTCLLLLFKIVFHVDPTNSTYVILNNLAQSVFYFLPVFVAYSAAKKFNTEPVLAMLLACWLLYPGWVTMAGAGGFTSYFGIPAMLKTYNGAVLQLILSVWVMAQIDKLLKQYLPISIRHFLKPFLLILLTSVITLTLTAPLGGLITNYIAAGINFVRVTAPWATVPAIIIFSATLGIFVPGFHLALIPIATTSLATYGYDDVINIWFFCSTITPGFIALWVALKTKRKDLKEIAFPASVSALFGGISEPTTYGITYKMPKIWLISVTTSLTTALYTGIVGLKCYGFGGYSLTNILLYLGAGNDTANFTKALIGVGLIAALSFILVFTIKWDDSVYDTDEENDLVGSKLASSKLVAPAYGRLVTQELIADSAFATGMMGSCFGIDPENGDIVAPIGGIINSIAPTKHAITIKSEDGAEVLIHIGIDSMKLNQNEIEVMTKIGQKVKQGELIAKIDLEAFKKNGVDDTIIVALLNSKDYKNVKFEAENKLLFAEV